MNGQLKDINKENDLFPYNNSNNITHNNMKLSDYLNLLEQKMKSIVYNNFNYKLYGWWSDKKITQDNTYEILSTPAATFNGRKNSTINPFKLNEDGSIELENIYSDLVFTNIRFISQCNSNKSGNKYTKVRIVRNGVDIQAQFSSVYNVGTNNSASCHVSELGAYLAKGDKIYFECLGLIDDNFSKNSYSIECENRFDSLEII